MAQQYHNPFARLGLIVPEAQRDYYDQYCQTRTVGKASIDQCPFRRKVDLWFVGLAFAARKQLKPINLNKQKTFRLITGEIFDRNSWQIHTLMLIAMAVDENVEIVLNPHRMMDIANGLAAAGVPHIVEMLRDGNQDPIWNLSDAFEELFQSDIKTEEQSLHARIAEALTI